MQSRIVVPAVRFVLPLIILSQLLPAFSSVCLADVPPFYIKKGTWYETLLASREAMARHRDEMWKSMGLKLGIYWSPGPLTCAGYAGSHTYEVRDAQQYAAWGIDYLKHDWCSYGRLAKDQSRAEYKKPYEVMRSALNGVQRDIIYSLCQYGMDNVWEWGDSRGEKSNRVTVTWEELGLTGPKSVRELWRQKDLGTVDGEYNAVVARHGASLITLR